MVADEVIYEIRRAWVDGEKGPLIALSAGVSIAYMSKIALGFYGDTDIAPPGWTVGMKRKEGPPVRVVDKALGKKVLEMMDQGRRARCL